MLQSISTWAMTTISHTDSIESEGCKVHSLFSCSNCGASSISLSSIVSDIRGVDISTIAQLETEPSDFRERVNETLELQIKALTDWSLNDESFSRDDSYSNGFTSIQHVDQSTQTNQHSEHLPDLSFLQNTRSYTFLYNTFDNQHISSQKINDRCSAQSSGYKSSTSLPVITFNASNYTLCHYTAGLLFTSTANRLKQIQSTSKLKAIPYYKQCLSDLKNSAATTEFNVHFNLNDDRFNAIRNIVAAIVDYSKDKLVLENLTNDELDMHMRKRLCPALREYLSIDLRVPLNKTEQIITLWSVIECLDGSMPFVLQIRKKAIQMANENAVSLSCNISQQILHKIRTTCFIMCLLNCHQLINWLRFAYESRNLIKRLYKQNSCVFCDKKQLAHLIKAVMPLNMLPFCLCWPPSNREKQNYRHASKLGTYANSRH
ncbi:hypothetical protein GJ496_010622 [Pomphorhynchus laevis]|nr:hypothetical protein GJ496_010622 [Pomphorhynchus laevis]